VAQRESTFKIMSYGVTDVGLERKNNEDAFHIVDDSGLYVVCDGMGGHASGELASRIAVDSVVQFVTNTIHGENFRWPFQSPNATTVETRVLDCAIRIANRKVYQQARADARHKGMGTTVVAMFAGRDRIGAAHVGDSRIYRLRDGVLRQLTEDHSLLNHYKRTRPMTEDEIRNFKGKNVIVRAVGLRETVEPETHVWDYRDGDVYLLCSDGLSDLVPDERLGQQMGQAEGGMKGAVSTLLQDALDAGGKDNITIMMLSLDGDADVSRATTQDMVAYDPGDDAGLEDTSPGFGTIDGDGFWDHETLPGLENDGLNGLRRVEVDEMMETSDDLPVIGAPVKSEDAVQVKLRDTPPAIPGLDDITPDEAPVVKPAVKKKNFARTFVDSAPPPMPVGRKPPQVNIRKTNPTMAKTEPYGVPRVAEPDETADTDKFSGVPSFDDPTPQAVPVVKPDDER